MVYLIIIGYIVLIFFGSLVTRSKTNTPDGYFLANRNLGTISLFFTILATNFSAFYFLGFAGEAYRIGYAYYVIMALGTSLACLSFYVIGARVWRLGKEHGFITPSELIYHQTGSRALATLFALVMIIFTFPYLALQIVGAGYIMESITGGEVSYFAGAIVLTIITIIYVFLGGMHSVARTDIKQGIIMVVLMIAAVAAVSGKLGGLTQANLEVAAQQPGLFQRAGLDAVYTDKKWFSFLVFWFFCIPMFPQLFMRFYVARDMDHLKRAALLYAIIPLFISILPVIIGVQGHLSFPGLTGQQADQILPMMLLEHGSKWFATLVMTGALAAFMSTLDSQLLALGTIVSRDFSWLKKGDITTDLNQQVRIGRYAIVAIAFIGLIIAWQPPATIFDMGKLAFAGLSVLFPVTFFVLRGGGIDHRWGIASILSGELVLTGFYYGWIPSEAAFGFEPFIPAIAISFVVCLICKGAGILNKNGIA